MEATLILSNMLLLNVMHRNEVTIKYNVLIHKKKKSWKEKVYYIMKNYI